MQSSIDEKQPLIAMLFVPASAERKLAKVAEGGVDAFILDLEDSVARSEKASARQNVASAIDTHGTTQHLYVRTNPFSSGLLLDDLLTVVRPGLAGLQVPKVETPDQVFALDWTIAELESRHGLRQGTVRILPTIETAKGVQNADSIAAASSRTRTLALGLGDLQHDLSLSATVPPRQNPVLTAARVALVLAARRAGLEPPHDSAYTNFEDDEGLLAEVAFSRSLGFLGKHAIHPRQVPHIRHGYRPTDDEVARAKEVVSAFARAEKTGVAALSVDGELVDYPIAWRAEKILKLREADGTDHD